MSDSVEQARDALERATELLEVTVSECRSTEAERADARGVFLDASGAAAVIARDAGIALAGDPEFEESASSTVTADGLAQLTATLFLAAAPDAAKAIRAIADSDLISGDRQAVAEAKRRLASLV